MVITLKPQLKNTQDRMEAAFSASLGLEMPTAQREELSKCRGTGADDARACEYFIRNYAYIYDATPSVSDWIPFDLWPAQVEALQASFEHRKVVALKARQVGLSWLFLAKPLWLSIFHPIMKVLLLSRREEEAKYLLSDERLQGMYQKLPPWIKEHAPIQSSSALLWKFRNGSSVRSLPCTAGDSYTVGYVLADEFDKVEDQKGMLLAVEPTTSSGGQLILLSKSDKERPLTEFKSIYNGAKQGKSDWHPVFLPWTARPGRDETWYQSQVAEVMSHSEGSLDDVHENYPLTDREALSPRSQSKRLEHKWLSQCWEELDPLPYKAMGRDAQWYPVLQDAVVYREREIGRVYVIGADPAEGNEASDDSAAVVGDAATGEEVCLLKGKYEPGVFAGLLAELSAYYNNAEVLPERNNHGHALILSMQTEHPEVPILPGLNGKEGWLTTKVSKATLYVNGADALSNGDAVIHSYDLYTQLSLIERGTLSAPQKMMDDLAVAFMLMLTARLAAAGYIAPRAADPEYDRGNALVAGSSIAARNSVSSDTASHYGGYTGAAHHSVNTRLPGRFT